jgi:UDP-glucose 4-epimerase
LEKAIVMGVFNFIGNHLCSKLLNNGIKIYGIDVKSEQIEPDVKDEKLMSIGRNANFKLLEQLDLDNEMTFSEEKIDTLFYCLEEDEMRKEPDQISNSLEQVIELCNANKIKLVFTSSLLIFNAIKGEVTEETKPNPTSKTGKRYLEIEELIRQKAEKEEIQYCIVRFPIVYGPWQGENYVYQKTIRLLEYGRNPSLIDEKEEPINDVLFVDDAVSALQLIGSLEELPKTIHITSGKENEWHKGMSYLLNRDVTPNSSQVVFLNDFAKSLLSFSPSTSIEEGLQLQRKHLKIRLENLL